jgi:hypothetical protein
MPGERKMRQTADVTSGLLVVLLAAAGFPFFPVAAQAQIRGQYTPGFTVTNSGTLPEPGLTYMNYFQLYSFDRLKGPHGVSIPVSGRLSVLIDHNVFAWTTEKKALGAKFVFAVDVPIASVSLTISEIGSISGGGLGDIWVQPITLGWTFSRADINAGYAIFAPTGKFEEGATDNIGEGYWGHGPFSGQTIYLTKNKKWAISAYEIYEFHSKQKDTDIKPGQSFTIDYSITRTFALNQDEESLLQLGPVGYVHQQTTRRRGFEIDPVIDNTRYRTYAIGAGANIILPLRKTILGVRYFREFANEATVEGESLQLYVGVTF